MNIQKEIREGVARIEGESAGDRWGGLESDLQEGAFDYADKILSYLHSQGVVIQVKRELFSSICGYCEHLDSCQEIHTECNKFALEAGLSAVEPLIEVKE